MILIVMSSFGMTYFIYFQLSELTKSIVQKQVERETELVAISLSSALWTFNNASIKSTGDSLLERVEDIDIVAVQVLDSEKKVVYYKNNETYNKENNEKSSQKSKPIVYNNENIGEVTVWADSSQFKNNFFKIVQLTTIIFFFVNIIVSFLSYVVLRRLLSKPLRVLKKSAIGLLNGNLRTRIDENLDYEFLVLAKAYNQMFDEIERRDKELRDYNVNLEKLVEQRTQETDLQKSLLIQASRLATLGEFAGNVAHEINNPLAVIQGNAQIINKAIAENNIEKVEKSTSKIISMVERIGKIINGLRSFARDGSQDKMLPFEMSKLFEVINDLATRRLQSRDISLKFNCQDTDRFVYGREIQLSQVIMNLINNASDAIENLPERWIEISCKNQDLFLYIFVTDSGFGISKEIREKMMNPFFTTKEIGKGTGLGLSISMGIVKDHGGELIYVEESKNTQFCIKLPKYIEDRKAG